MHWISFAMKNRYYAFGNRGSGCGNYPGVLIRTAKPHLNFESIQDIQHKSACRAKVSWKHNCKGVFRYSWLYLQLTLQKGPSCSRASTEAGAILGGIGVTLCDEYEQKSPGDQLGEKELKQIHDSALSIFQEWINFDHELNLKKIMSDGNLVQDQDLYVRFLASLKTTSQVAEDFYHFLASSGPIPWFGLDQKHNIPCDYVPRTQDKQKNYANIDNLFAKVVTKAKEQYNSDDEGFWALHLASSIID